MNKLVYNSLQTNYLVCPVKSVIRVSEKSGVCAGLFNEIKRTTNGDVEVGTGSSSTRSERQFHRQRFQTVPVLVLVDGLIRSKVYEMLLNQTHV